MEIQCSSVAAAFSEHVTQASDFPSIEKNRREHLARWVFTGKDTGCVYANGQQSESSREWLTADSSRLRRPRRKNRLLCTPLAWRPTHEAAERRGPHFRTIRRSHLNEKAQMEGGCGKRGPSVSFRSVVRSSGRPVVSISLGWIEDREQPQDCDSVLTNGDGTRPY